MISRAFVLSAAFALAASASQAAITSTLNLGGVDMVVATQTRADWWRIEPAGAASGPYRYVQFWRNSGPSTVGRVTIDVPCLACWEDLEFGLFGADPTSSFGLASAPVVDDRDGTGSWSFDVAHAAAASVWLLAEWGAAQTPLARVDVLYGRAGGSITPDGSELGPEDTTGAPAPAPVPLPAPAWLLAAALAALAATRRVR